MCICRVHSLQNADLHAFIVLAGFADNTLTGKTCLFVGLGLLAVVVVQTVVHYLSDRLQVPLDL